MSNAKQNTKSLSSLRALSGADRLKIWQRARAAFSKSKHLSISELEKLRSEWLQRSE